MADVTSAIHVGLNVWELEDPDDPPGLRLVYANPAAAAAMGRPLEAMIGRTMRESFPELLETDRPAAYARVALGGESTLANFIQLVDGDEPRTFFSRVFSLPNRRVGVAFNDVTRERTAEARAFEIIESMSDAFVTFDPEWRYTYMNDASERFTELSRDEKMGKNLWELFPSLIGSELDAAFHRAMRENVTVGFEEHLERFEKWCSVKAYPGPNGLSVFYHDITEQKALETRLRQAEKLEAVGSLAGGIAHDFNNILTIIRGAAAIALGAADEGVAHAKLLQIDGAAEHAAALTHQLLAFSRQQVLRPQATDLNLIVGDTLDLAERLIGENVVVTRRFEVDLHGVMVDRNQLAQIVLNLSVNASEAMPDGGSLMVRTTQLVLDATHGAVRIGVAPGSYGVVELTDSGLGMDDATRSRVFDPFFTTKPAGTGLGLATVFGIVKQSGGHVDVYSELGLGTTVRVYLPFATQPVAPHVDPESVTAVEGTETILVVDDDELVRSIVAEMLESYGYTVRSASDGLSAIAVADGDVGTISLLLTDMVMPGLDGRALAERLVEIYPGLRVVFTSGYPAGAVAHRGIANSRMSFIQKPFVPLELARTVRSTLDADSETSLPSAA